MWTSRAAVVPNGSAKLLVCGVTPEYRDRAKYFIDLLKWLHVYRPVIKTDKEESGHRIRLGIVERSISLAPTDVQAGRGLRYN